MDVCIVSDSEEVRVGRGTRCRHLSKRACGAAVSRVLCRSGVRGEGAVAGGPAPDWPLRTARLTLRPHREDGLAGPAGSVSQLDLGFETYGLHRVVAQMDARNPTPARMAGTLHAA